MYHLKLITNRNTTEILGDIEEFRLHNIPINGGGGNDFHDKAANLPLPKADHTFSFVATGMVSTDLAGAPRYHTESYDDLYYEQAFPFNAAVLDIRQKNCRWRRLIVAGYGYLCNNDGRTIQKIND